MGIGIESNRNTRMNIPNHYSEFLVCLLCNFQRPDHGLTYDVTDGWRAGNKVIVAQPLHWQVIDNKLADKPSIQRQMLINAFHKNGVMSTWVVTWAFKGC